MAPSAKRRAKASVRAKCHIRGRFGRLFGPQYGQGATSDDIAAPSKCGPRIFGLIRAGPIYLSLAAPNLRQLCASFFWGVGGMRARKTAAGAVGFAPCHDKKRVFH